MISIKPANREILTEFIGMVPRHTIQAFVAEENGSPLMVAGSFRQDGRATAFLEIREEARQRKSFGRAMVMLWRRFGPTLSRYTVPVMAQIDPNRPKAGEMLEHFGFKRYHENQYILCNT